jgi:hypothetical protein
MYNVDGGEGCYHILLLSVNMLLLLRAMLSASIQQNNAA